MRAPEEEIQGASDEQLAALETRLERSLPPQLIEFLRMWNGAGIGPGGFFGYRPDRTHLDLPTFLDLFPQWRAKGWIPVAGDGCGNYYVLLDDNSVGFVDTVSDPVSLEAGTRHPDLFAFVEAVLVNDQAKPDHPH